MTSTKTVPYGGPGAPNCMVFTVCGGSVAGTTPEATMVSLPPIGTNVIWLIMGTISTDGMSSLIGTGSLSR